MMIKNSFAKKRRKMVKPHRSATRHFIFDYKDPRFLQKFISEDGAIITREETGLTQKQQRALATAVKRARHLAMMAFTQTL